MLSAEAIVAVALRARAAAIDPADELDPSPLDFIFNAHGASALDQVARDHGAAHDVSATSRPVRCLGFALTDRTASTVIFQLRRVLAAWWRVQLAIELARDRERLADG